MEEKGFSLSTLPPPVQTKSRLGKKRCLQSWIGRRRESLIICLPGKRPEYVCRDILSPGWHHSFSLHPTLPPNIHFEYHCLVQGAFCNSENIFFDVKKWKTMLGNIQIFQIFQGILAIIFQKMWNCLLLSRLINKITYWKELNFVFMLEHWTINLCWIFLNNQRSRIFTCLNNEETYWFVWWFILIAAMIYTE